MSQNPDAENAVPSKEYIDNIIETTTDDSEHPKEIADLLSGNYALANMNSADRKYFRLLADNIKIFAEERYPPADSYMQGALGAALLDDPEYDREALTTAQKNRIETALMEMFARSSRSVGGWQQDKFSESIQTNRVEDNRDSSRSEPESSGGITGFFKK